MNQDDQEDGDGDEPVRRPKAAKLLGVSVRFLEVNATTGKGPPMIKIGRSVRYLRRDLREFMEARRVTSTSMQPGITSNPKKK